LIGRHDARGVPVAQLFTVTDVPELEAVVPPAWVATLWRLYVPSGTPVVSQSTTHP
jgi:hypothetical protein